MVAWKSYALLTLVALSSSTLVAADEKPCTIHDSEGDYYDMNPLKSSTDYEFKSAGGHDFVINVCKPISKHETWHLPDADEVAGYMRRDHGDFSIGLSNTTMSIRNGHPTLTLTGGSPCTRDPDELASTIIEFVCDMSVFGAGKPEIFAMFPQGNEDDACGFVLEWRTHYACATGKRGGHLGILVILLIIAVILLMLYIVAGTMYNRFALNRRGGDQIPEFSFGFLQAIVRWMVDSTYHSLDGLGGSKGLNPASHQWGGAAPPDRPRGRRGRAARVPATIEEEEAMLGEDDDGDHDAPPPPPPHDAPPPPPRDTGAGVAAGSETGGAIRL